jgi:putative spermidine/putrescine transport system substrate-binding protein
MKHKRWLAGLAVSALLLGACGSDDDGGGADTTAAPEGSAEAPESSAAGGAGGEALTELGEGEGEVNLIAWAGYVEDGSTDPEVDWVTGFEEETGCNVNVKLGNTSDEMVALMQSGEYDGVSASGDATLRLIAGGEVSPVNTDLIPNYADVFPDLKDQPHNTVDGVPYGVPHGRGANLLVYNTDSFTTPPDTWGVMFEPDSPAKGGVSVYDSPIYIADAALYLMNTQPDLGIENPYSLDADQLAAAVDVLKTQKAEVGEYWSDYLAHIQSFTNGDSVIGTTWQSNVNALQADKVPVDAILPDEGSTGWIDTWMVAADSPHSNCAYAWLDHIVSPKTQAALTEYYGEAPANAKACDFTADKNFCDTYHAADAAYVEKIWYWTTPISACLDGRTNVKCTDYGDWTQAWTEVKG